MNDLLQTELWESTSFGERPAVANVQPLAVAVIHVFNEMWPGSGSSFIREQIRGIWGGRFSNDGGMCGLISRLLENPDDYPARHRSAVKRLRPQVAQLIASKLKAPLRTCQKIAKE
jgi:hypothetical protein